LNSRWAWGYRRNYDPRDSRPIKAALLLDKVRSAADRLLWEAPKFTELLQLGANPMGRFVTRERPLLAKKRSFTVNTWNGG
jgi:hypothetical protein